MRKMFSENQIKNIVNQGIKSGEISGGTKLYRHTIILEDSNEITWTLVLINNYPEQITTANYEHFYGIVQFSYSEDVNGIISYACTNNDLDMCIVISSNGQSVSITNVDGIQSDEVTPL